MPLPPHFAHQDLRNRSFQRRDLSGADFSQADLRGCDFSRAVLTQANFAGARLGQTRRQRFILWALALVVGLVVFDAVSRMVFGAIGQTPEEPAWKFVLALYVSLGIAGTGIAIKVLSRSPRWLKHLAGLISGIAAGALVGFFYGGTIGGAVIERVNQTDTGKDSPQTAIAGAILLGLLMAIALLRLRRDSLSVVVIAAGAVTAYGFSFLVGTTAITNLSTHPSAWGAILGIVSLVYLWFTVSAVAAIGNAIHTLPGTLFRSTVLTHANFDGAELENADFRGAVGRDFAR